MSVASGVGSVVLRRLFYIWRLVWTAFAFAVLGVGGFVFGTTVIPVATLFLHDEQARTRRAQFIIRQSLRTYVAMLRVLGVLKLEVVGARKLSSCRGKLIIANHPTLIDVVLLTSLLPDSKCVVKSEIFRNRLMRPIAMAAGHIRNDYEPEVLIEKCREALTAGSNLIIFPEGTRSIPGRPLHFKRGFAHIAIMTGVILQTITITCKPITLLKGKPYYRIPDSRPSFRIEIADEIDPKQLLELASVSRAQGARLSVSTPEQKYITWPE